MTTNAVTTLRLEGLSLPVRLGCEAEERAIPQEVRITAEFRFEHPLKAEYSDDLGDTVCYAEVCDALRALCCSREFKLIERMGAECLAVIRTIAGDGVRIALTVHKVRPPVEGLTGGAIYTCGDFLLSRL